MHRFHRRIKTPTRVPAYQMAGYGYYDEYVKSDEFQGKRQKHKKNYPKSYYCFICDCTISLNWHHTNYDNIPNEDVWHDLTWVCDERCPCDRGCHFKAHKLDNGERIDLFSEEYQLKLKSRLKVLRKRYVADHLTALTLVYYTKRFIYRKIW